MERSHSIIALCCALLLIPFPAAGEEGVPVAVSPGAPGGITTILDRCPTFSWGAVPYAHGYELQVFEISPAGLPQDGDSRVPGTPRVRVEVPASATSWTPSAADCLEPGGVYGWRLRELGGYGRPDGEWSAANRFEVVTARHDDGHRPAALRGRERSGPDREAAGPAVASAELLSRLDRLEALVARVGSGGEAATSIESLERKVDTLSEWLIPCTPEDYREGLCDTRGGHPLNLEFTVCGDVHLGANLAAELGVEGGLEISGGIGNSTVLWGKATGNASFPAFTVSPIGGIPIVLPTKVGLDASAGGNLTLQVCLAGLTVPVGRDADARRSADRRRCPGLCRAGSGEGAGPHERPRPQLRVPGGRPSAASRSSTSSPRSVPKTPWRSSRKEPDPFVTWSTACRWAIGRANS